MSNEGYLLNIFQCSIVCEFILKFQLQMEKNTPNNMTFIKQTLFYDAILCL